MINQRLFDWYGIDTKKDLGLKTFCRRPFDTVLIDKNGSCFACECTAWLPQSIGNLNLLGLQDILQSTLREQLQKTIIDGTYRYCNDGQCSYLLEGRPDVFSTTPLTPQIKNIRLAIDDSCNLSCPSCRKETIFVKSGKLFEQRMRLARRVIEYISMRDTEINLHLGSDGDPFASLIYRYIMRETKNFPHVRFSLHTNGLLIKKMYHRHIEIFKKISVLNISIDGASQSTYERLRRGGSFDKIIENLEFVKEIKSKLGFRFAIHFVVQAENYKEMPDIIRMAEKYSADNILLNKIDNWNTFVKFEEKNIMDTRHPEHAEFKNILRKIKNKIQSHSNVDFIEIPTLNHGPKKNTDK